MANRPPDRITNRKTNLMRQAEKLIGEDVESYVRRQIADGDVHLQQLADDLDVSLSTLGYWMMRWHIWLAYVAVFPGDRVYAIDEYGNERLVLVVA